MDDRLIKCHEDDATSGTLMVHMVSTDDKIPCGARRQQLHKMGAVIHLVDFFTAWDERKVRGVIENSLAGMIDNSKPDPRYENWDSYYAFKLSSSFYIIDFNFSRLSEEILWFLMFHKCRSGLVTGFAKLLVRVICI